MNYAELHERIDKNPLKIFKKQRETPRDRILTEEEKEWLIDSVSENAAYLIPLIRYCLMVPCRSGEITALKRDAVDMFGRCLRIPADLTKNGKAVIKPIPAEMMEYFKNIPAQSEYVFYRPVVVNCNPFPTYPTAPGVGVPTSICAVMTSVLQPAYMSNIFYLYL